MIACTPSGAALCNLTRDAALHSSRMKSPDGSNWTVAWSIVMHQVDHATGTCHKLCGGVLGVCCVPREVTYENEPFVIISSAECT